MGFQWDTRPASELALKAGENMRAALREGSDKGGKRMVEIVKANTPVETFAKQIAVYEGGQYTPIEAPGHLRDSIAEIKMRVYFNENGDLAYETGAETDVYYAPYVEEGTGLWGPQHREYVIRPKKAGGWLSWITTTGFTRKDGKLVPPGTRVFAKEVRHPGSPGNHMFAIGVAMVEAEFDELMNPVLDEWAKKTEEGW